MLLVAISQAAEGQPVIAPAELAAVKAAEAARVQAIDSVYGAVVAIYGNDRGGGGSGVIYDPAGYALTNHHVIGGAGLEGWGGLADGKLYRWKLVGTDPGGDVAIIKLEGKDKFPAAPLGDSDAVRVGDWAFAAGNPFTLAEDQRPTVTLGIVSGVKRFQEGSGLNQLVYGNCIQVDSSINPGNSGGPLFNLRGQIIGINGRGSFEERGRVNVGLGYAISSNQIKNFIPELLSTKIARHGTLDAIFGNRTAGVICFTVNLDSPAARAGLALGDKLVAFEGEPIETANQFTNLISTYPEGWPVELVVEREGAKKTIHTRLSYLPYEPIVRPGSKPPEKPKPEEKPAEPPKPGEPMPPMPPPEFKIEQRPKLPLGDAGKIRDAKLNRAIAEQIVARWRQSAGATEKDSFRLQAEIRRGAEVVGEQTLSLASGGRIRADYTVDGRRTIIATDGKTCWNDLPDKDPQTVLRGKALLDPHFAQGIALAALLGTDSLTNWGELALDGSDKAGGRLCYRLSVTDAETSEQLFVWLSVHDAGGQPRIELVKTGVGLDDDEPIAGTLFGGDLVLRGFQSPRVLVRGLAENKELTAVFKSVELTGEILAAEFEPKP
ncbi:MAG TPA: trypsin-like peptidase domain-containing protein [Pirellulaceae bacterium]|nr:trypsin-like peptidase domain-containing protein [Pirellulaceae bacterium]